MLLEIACPVCRKPAWATAGAQLQRTFQMPQFDPESRQCRDRVDDQPTAVTGELIALVGIRPRLNRAVDTDRVQKYSTYAEAALSAQSRLRELSFSTQSTDGELEEADKQEEIIRTSAIRMFSLLKPMLRYHEFWDEVEYGHISGDGLKQLREFEDRRSELPVDDAFTAVQEMRTATHAFGLLYDNQEQVFEAMEGVDYWMNELEQASGADTEDTER